MRVPPANRSLACVDGCTLWQATCAPTRTRTRALAALSSIPRRRGRCTLRQGWCNSTSTHRRPSTSATSPNIGRQRTPIRRPKWQATSMRCRSRLAAITLARKGRVRGSTSNQWAATWASCRVTGTRASLIDRLPESGTLGRLLWLPCSSLRASCLYWRACLIESCHFVQP